MKWKIFKKTTIYKLGIKDLDEIDPYGNMVFEILILIDKTEPIYKLAKQFEKVNNSLLDYLERDNKGRHA